MFHVPFPNPGSLIGTKGHLNGLPYEYIHRAAQVKNNLMQ